MKRFGQTWSREGHFWSAVVDERFRALTWPFGTIHQCKVLVTYPHAMWAMGDTGQAIGMCLPCGKTRDEAMTRALAWIEAYKVKGPPPPEEVVAKCFRDYPDLYESRDDVIDSLFFSSSGSEYDWLDGAIINTDGDDPPQIDKSWLTDAEGTYNDLDALVEAYPDLKERLYGPNGKSFRQQRDEAEAARKAEKASRKFELRSSSNICLIPPDLRPEWRPLVVEAAKLLLKRGTPATHEVARTAIARWG